MDIIHLLPDHVANQIAAGEVVQRPASVVKELMENAVDAGADKIEVWITDAGKTSVQVIDNGKGMSETDARMAFERHATSKISKAADLFDLHTMGFRGEALASIAAVAQVELKTRTIEDELGVHLVLNGADVVEQHPVVCDRGAQFAVKNLFYNVPVRRRFLKSDATEMRNILQEFERIALINPDIDFLFYRDNVQVLDLRKGSFKKRIVDLFGSAMDKNLLPVHVDTSIVKIEGFVGTPESARLKGARQFFFVNGRFMRHPYFYRAIQTAFERLISPDRMISYFYCLTVDPSRIDVNIHPTKTEIKFEDEQAVWQIILAATKETLGTLNVVPALDFEPSAVPDIPVMSSVKVSPPEISYDKKYNPFKDTTGNNRVNTRNWDRLYEGLRSVPSQGNGETLVPEEENTPSLYAVEGDGEKRLWEKDDNVFLQYGRFILTSVQSGLMVINQQYAHIRILYDTYMSNLSHADGISQGLLFPELFQVPASQVPVMKKLMGDFKAVGFEIEDTGGGSFAINGVPAGIEKHKPVEIILHLLERYKEKGVTEDAVHSSIAFNLAKSNAISPAQRLSVSEMSYLVSQLLQSETPKYTPDGKVIIAMVSEDGLEKMMR